MQLNLQNLSRLSASDAVHIPPYARNAHDALQPGIVHLGLGAFYRAHVAWYTDAVLNAGDARWGIVGVSLRQPDTRDALGPQNGLYTVSMRDASGERLQVIGALLRCLVAPEDPEAVLAAMADARCHIVSLTVTEKGYCHDPATGSLRIEHPDIAHDLTNPAQPRSAIGFIVRALARRRAHGLAPFTVLSCDNLPSNGDTTRALVVAFARACDPLLATWIEQAGAFPNSMVDRIVPKTTDDDRARIAGKLGLVDAWPVNAEPFTQWVIEDRFAGPRPSWENAGATFVARAEPYEHAKLRMLNGSHSTLAYLGATMGIETADAAMSEPLLARFVEDMMREEIAPTLVRPGLDAYRDELLARFRNPALKHRLQQIAMDGSQKLPQRLLGTIRARLAAGASCERLCLALAGWLRYLEGRDEAGQAYPISDPLADRLQAAVTGSAEFAQKVRKVLQVQEVFGQDLPANQDFVAALTRHLHVLHTEGVRAALQKI